MIQQQEFLKLLWMNAGSENKQIDDMMVIGFGLTPNL
jgi:hypothetical protein